MIKPLFIPIREIPIPKRMTPLNRWLMRSAIAAGKMMMAETSKAPTIGMATAIVIPVIVLKIIDIHLTGKPEVKAVSSSNIRI